MTTGEILKELQRKCIIKFTNIIAEIDEVITILKLEKLPNEDKSYRPIIFLRRYFWKALN